MILIYICIYLCSDCGVFVAAFAEYLVHGLAIPGNLNIEDMRSRYAVSLYSYGKRKHADGIDSEDERPGRLQLGEKGKKIVG